MQTKFLIPLIIWFISSIGIAQMLIQNGDKPNQFIDQQVSSTAKIVPAHESYVQYLIEEVLLGGSCTEIRNIEFHSAKDGSTLLQIGEFTKGNNLDIGFDNGIVLSTGKVADVEGPNLENDIASTEFDGLGGFSDPDIENSKDAAIIEFDFKPVSENLVFNYVFASEEYPQFVCDFSDVFYFYISKVGSSDPPENIALLPVTKEPVSIDTVNDQYVGGSSNPCPANDNSQFYINNAFDQPNTIFNGYTTVLTAEKNDLEPCSWYHLKIVVSDIDDSEFDSAVFLETNSLNTNSELAILPYGSSGQYAIVEESCTDGYFLFKRPEYSEDISEDLEVEFVVKGTATEEDDYEKLVRKITIPANEQSIQLSVSALYDTSTESPPETIIIETTEFFCDCGDSTTPVQATMRIADYSLEIDTIEVTYCDEFTHQLPDGTETTTAGVHDTWLPRDTNSECEKLFTTIIHQYATPKIKDVTILDYICFENEDLIVDLTKHENDFITESNTNQFNITYYETEEDFNSSTNAIADPTSYALNSNEIFVSISRPGEEACSTSSKLTIPYSIKPKTTELTLSECITDVTNGTAEFNLSATVSDILQSQTTNTVSFHESFDDANAQSFGGTNPIPTADLSSYTSSSKTIYARSEQDTGTSVLCYSISKIILQADEAATEVNEKFEFCTVLPVQELAIEDIQPFVNSTETIQVFYSLEDAQNNQNEIQLPIETDSQVFYVKTTAQSGCTAIGTFEVAVHYLEKYKFQDTVVCTNTGGIQFDLTTVIPQDDTDGLHFTFHETEADASVNVAGGQNAITILDNSNTEQEIFVRIEQDTPSGQLCFAVTSFKIVSWLEATKIDTQLDFCTTSPTYNLVKEDVEPLVKENESIQLFANRTDAETNQNEISLPLDTESNEFVTKVTTDKNCTTYGSLKIAVHYMPEHIFEDLTLCTSDGFVHYDLPTLIPESVKNDPSLFITFHKTETDATAAVFGGENAVTQLDTNTNETTVYVRIERKTNSSKICFRTTTFKINSSLAATVVNKTLEFCEFTATYELKASDIKPFLRDTEQFKLYYNKDDAEQEVNQISLPLESPTQEFVIKVTTDKGCEDYGVIKLFAYQKPNIEKNPVYVCSKYGIQKLNLDELRSDLEEVYDNYRFVFYESENSTTPITTIGSEDPDEITVQIIDKTNACDHKVTLPVIYTEMDVEEIEHQLICVDENYELKNGEIVNEPGYYTDRYFNTATQCDAIFRININHAEILFPNAFTPNVDGHNDFFKPVLLARCDFNMDSYDLKVFNRWGNLVFTSDNPEIGWDGNYHSRSKAAPYLWTVEYTIKGEVIKKNGIVNLIR